jgi:hypothetical protein
MVRSSGWPVSSRRALGAVVIAACADLATAEGGGRSPLRILDFAGHPPTCRSIDDVVTGGVSSSERVVEDGVAIGD